MAVYKYCTEIDDPRLSDTFAELGADLMTLDENNNTLLHWAIAANQKNVLNHAIQLFRESSHSIDQKNNDNFTAYFLLITDEVMLREQGPHETRDTLEKLLEEGADPLSTKEEHETCLDYAVTMGRQVS